MDPRCSNKGFPPLTSINGTGCRWPPQTRKGEEDKQPLTLGAPQGPNTRTSNGNNIFFHSAQGQAATATAVDAAMLRRTTTPSSSSSSVFRGATNGRQAMDVMDLLLPAIFPDHVPELLLPPTHLNFACCPLLL